jgi:hypothetical protein
MTPQRKKHEEMHGQSYSKRYGYVPFAMAACGVGHVPVLDRRSIWILRIHLRRSGLRPPRVFFCICDSCQDAIRHRANGFSNRSSRPS